MLATTSSPAVPIASHKLARLVCLMALIEAAVIITLLLL